jgi:HK97 family phage prohead protease
MTTMTPEKLEALRGAPERRSLAVDDFEIRKDGDGLVIEGYASVFERGYDIYGGPSKGGFTEIVDRAAFNKTLGDRPDVHLLINHEGMPLARTKSGTLQLSTDKVGLRARADLDRRDPDVQSLEVKMERGDMDEMSFAFRTVRDEFNEETAERRLLEVNINKGDVSIVNFGANPHTSVKARTLDEAIDALLDLDLDLALVEVRSIKDVDKLVELRRRVSSLCREVAPPSMRPMTVAEARALLDS